MPKFNANIQFMFNEHDLLDRYDAAAAAGFRAVEVQAPYSVSPSEIRHRLDANGLKHIIINMAVDDPETGINNLPLLPGPRPQGTYDARISRVVEYASKLGCIGVNIGTGQLPEDLDRELAYETLIGRVRQTADALFAEGIKAFIEPLNTRDNPRQLIATTTDGMRLINDANHPNIQLQFDFYHTQIMEGDLITRFRDLLPHIGHVQFADNPGRREPGTGEINYGPIFDAIDASGYNGWVGAEYHPSPSGTTLDSLGWFTPHSR